MPTIWVKVIWLVYGHKDGHTHTDRTDCYIRTTKLVGKKETQNLRGVCGRTPTTVSLVKLLQIRYDTIRYDTTRLTGAKK